MDENTPEHNVVVFGAGAAGRGLIALLFSQAGYHVTFVDIRDDLVTALRDSGVYRVLIHCLDGGHPSAGCRQEECTVQGFRILHAADREAVAREIIQAKLVVTAVFAQNLPDVARTIALGIEQCRRAGRQTPLNCIACENMRNSSTVLGGCVRERLRGEDVAWCEVLVGFPDCMINRVVPAPTDPLRLETEDYCEWTADVAGVKGRPPEGIDFIEWVGNQNARLDRKLMVYNGGHAACAYFAHPRGHIWIHEAAADPEVVRLVDGTLNELAAVVQRRHGFSDTQMDDYKRDFRRRCRNQGLRDTVVRVGRDPIRKLGRHERLIAPAKLAQQYALPRDHILDAIIAALRFHNPDDPPSIELAERINRDGLRKTLAAISDLPPTDSLLDELEGRL
jgi:mannitol-1-phosphate 5-dehydrogenase